MLETIDSGEKVTLKANVNYWEGKPALAGVVFKTVPDALVRVLEFKKGAIDFMQNDLEPDILPWLKRIPTPTSMSIKAPPFSISASTSPIRFSNSSKCAKPWPSPSIATRSSVICSKTPAMPPAAFLRQSIGHSMIMCVWPYDPEKARAARRGRLRDPDGAGPLPRFRLSFKTTNIDLRRRIAEALKEQLAKSASSWKFAPTNGAHFLATLKKATFISTPWPG